VIKIVTYPSIAFHRLFLRQIGVLYSDLNNWVPASEKDEKRRKSKIKIISREIEIPLCHREKVN